MVAWHMGRHWSGQVSVGTFCRSSLEGGHGLSKPHFRVAECSSWELWERSLGPAAAASS